MYDIADLESLVNNLVIVSLFKFVYSPNKINTSESREQNFICSLSNFKKLLMGLIYIIITLVIFCNVAYNSL